MSTYRESAKRDPDPVQSLRVASTLADRYRAVVSATYIDTSALELAIGEAQQIYPEIWRHLDEGRDALAAKDRDVRVFDGLRGEALRTLGVTDVDRHSTSRSRRHRRTRSLSASPISTATMSTSS